MASQGKQYHITQHGSTTHNPDFNWCQIQETITMLALAVAQVETSMKDGEQSVSTLSDAFSRMTGYIENIDKATASITTDNLETYKETVRKATQELSKHAEKSVTAFQFYDRISQRLAHVCDSLDKLGALISDPKHIEEPTHWQALQEHIKNSYTMEAERLMFEHILRGESIEEALQIYRHHFDKKETGDDTDDEIELF
ncbi:hypothetical protein HF888_07630 [Bermanella marisrubri]|uniref:Uncharacterized protein n=1 Tax=Bermanella marisrubri TaxID=207949 RepID=Q1N4S8_9GAMM|nr:hypothetical protein [Bermanella marisrubri]EAT13350.1 hypothetical protein RED65_01280 [Oceanobacter sp. RED65] [Bermanella marisrubri]QIZ84106.1 hypothetical protein HF888_07630 [Bermanella marisrubri]